jgi:translation elongation factor EF-1alpha
MSTVDWAESRFNEIKSMVEPFLRDTCGYSECKFIPIDSISNLNVHKPVENTWYKDDFLLKALENIKLP